MKTLYFEGAGCSYAATDETDVGNYRIRTSFINNIGDQIYLECGAMARMRYKSLYGNRTLKHPVIATEWALRVDSVLNVSQSSDENVSGIRVNRFDITQNYLYTKADIVKWVNETLDCSFDGTGVLPYQQYSVHGKQGKINLMESYTG